MARFITSRVRITYKKMTTIQRNLRNHRKLDDSIGFCSRWDMPKDKNGHVKGEDIREGHKELHSILNISTKTPIQASKDTCMEFIHGSLIKFFQSMLKSEKLKILKNISYMRQV